MQVQVIVVVRRAFLWTKVDLLRPFSKKKTLCQFDYEKKDVVTRNVKVAKVELGNL